MVSLFWVDIMSLTNGILFLILFKNMTTRKLPRNTIYRIANGASLSFLNHEYNLNRTGKKETITEESEQLTSNETEDA